MAALNTQGLVKFCNFRQKSPFVSKTVRDQARGCYRMLLGNHLADRSVSVPMILKSAGREGSHFHGESVFLRGQPRHFICTNASSRGSSATAERVSCTLCSSA